MKRLFFGTDGIRGKVGVEPMTVDFILKLGWAAGKVFSSQGKHTVVIGKDTRISGYMFESALEAGLAAAGLDVLLLGPIPTPAIAYLTRAQRAIAGIVISASHNPCYDDGVKFFDGNGFKLADQTELDIEAMLAKPLSMVDSESIGKATRMDDAKGRYIEFCKSTMPFNTTLKGMKLVVDCAHGATYHIAPAVFRELGAEVIEVGTQPDGLNINRGVGAIYPESIRSVVLENNADVGISFDGDGDRLIMMDAQGNIKNGDQILYLIAQSKLQKSGAIAGVVGTLMSNLGLEHALKRQGIAFERAEVGDRYVMESLVRLGWQLGGESSGHIICLDKTTTGDGVIAALQVLDWLVSEQMELSDPRVNIALYPQKMINVPLSGKLDLQTVPKLQDAVRETEAVLKNRGRVLLRSSGTESLIRVMVEGEDSVEVEQLAQRLADCICENAVGS